MMTKKSDFDSLPLKEKINRLITAYNRGMMSMYISHGGEAPHHIQRTKAYRIFFPPQVNITTMQTHNPPQSIAFKAVLPHIISVYHFSPSLSYINGTLRAIFPYIRPFLPISVSTFVETFKRMISYIYEIRKKREANRKYIVKYTGSAGYVVTSTWQIIRADSKAYALLMKLLKQNIPKDHPASIFIYRKSSKRNVIYLVTRCDGNIHVRVGHSFLITIS